MKREGRIQKHTKLNTDSLKNKVVADCFQFSFARRVRRRALQISILNSRKIPRNA